VKLFNVTELDGARCFSCSTCWAMAQAVLHKLGCLTLQHALVGTVATSWLLVADMAAAAAHTCGILAVSGALTRFVFCLSCRHTVGPGSSVQPVRVRRRHSSDSAGPGPSTIEHRDPAQPGRCGCCSSSSAGAGGSSEATEGDTGPV
jgi:hypothetical protein